MNRRLVGIIGFPVKHSVSPAFQQAALDYYSLPARYEAWETPPDQLAALVSQLRQPDYLGANVTVPYKEAVLPLLDEVDPVAARIAAVNTIVSSDGRLRGHNTDVTGFLMALDREAGYQVEGKTALVLGAGGAARAVVFALIEGGARAIVIANRRVERAEVLKEHAIAAAAYSSVSAIGMEERLLSATTADCDLIVNCTTVGTRYSESEGSLPLPDRLIRRGHLVYDLVYNPEQTPILEAARRVGAQTLNGLPMLVYQGAAAFELWTGKTAPVGLMFERARAALRLRA